MMKQTSIPVAYTGLPERESGALAEARLREFCEWFDLEMPALRKRQGKLYMTDELLQFCEREGASLDWLICGDAKVMAAVARRVWREENQVKELISNFDEKERQIVLKHLRAREAGEISADDAMGRINDEVKEHRRAKAAQA